MMDDDTNGEPSRTTHNSLDAELPLQVMQLMTLAT